MENGFISLTEDKGVLKRLLEEGAVDSKEKQAGVSPSTGDEVAIHYTGRLEDKTLFDCSGHDAPFHFLLNKQQVIRGLDVAVFSMRIGERAEFMILPEYAYGKQSAGLSVPPNATLIFDITLVDFNDFFMMDKHSMNVWERLQAAMEAKEKGNDYFKKNNIQSALTSYLHASNLVEPDDPEQPTLPDHYEPVAVSTYLNAATCYLLLKQWENALKYAQKALVYEPNNCKIVFRCGVAHLELRELEKSKAELLKCARLEPHNQEIRRQLQMWKAASLLEKIRHKRTFGGIFEHNKTSSKLPCHSPTSTLIGFVIKTPANNALYPLVVELNDDTLPEPILSTFLKLIEQVYQVDPEKFIGYRNATFHYINKGVMVQVGTSHTIMNVTTTSSTRNAQEQASEVYSKGSVCIGVDVSDTLNIDLFITCCANCLVDPAYQLLGKVIQGGEVLEHIQEQSSSGLELAPCVLLSQIL